LPGLEVGGVAGGELAEFVDGGAGECGQLVRDLDLAVLADGADSDGYGAGLVAGRHAGVGDVLAWLAVGDKPGGVLAVGAGCEDSSRHRVVGCRGWEARVPSVRPVLFTARGEQAECLAGREGDPDAAG